MARWTSCARGSGCGACPGCTATTCWPARRACGRCSHAEPGTYVLTDYLVRSFQRTVVAGLGLDAHPELWPDYFRHYRRVVWLAQDRSAPMQAEAEQVAARFGLPLTVIETGTSRLEAELARLVGDEPSSCAETAARPPARSARIPAGAPARDGSL